jgi:hypothetical protein
MGTGSYHESRLSCQGPSHPAAQPMKEGRDRLIGFRISFNPPGLPNLASDKPSNSQVFYDCHRALQAMGARLADPAFLLNRFVQLTKGPQKK